MLENPVIDLDYQNKFPSPSVYTMRVIPGHKIGTYITIDDLYNTSKMFDDRQILDNNRAKLSKIQLNIERNLESIDLEKSTPED